MKESWCKDGGAGKVPVTQAAWTPVGVQEEFASVGAGGQDAVSARAVLDYPMATPWKRWCARLFDLWWENAVIGIVAVYVLSWIWPAFLIWIESTFASKLFDIACLPLALVLDAAVHALAGNTPGKAILGLRVGLVDGRRLSFVQHLRRNLGVWVSGLGFAIPLVCLFTMGRQHGRLNEGQPASYDGERYRVRAKSIGWGRRAAFGAVFILLFAALTGAEIADRVESRKTAARLKGPSFSWTNPATGRSASVSPHWEHTEQTSEDGLVLHQFTQHSDHAVVIIAPEDSGGMSLPQYAGEFTRSRSADWRMREGFLEDFRGQASWTAIGEQDDGKLRLQVRLVQKGGTVWRVVVVQSAPMEHTDELVNELTGKLWDTVVPGQDQAP
ncbi:RDD family protein [Massilia sp. AB1]|uniref:RDD family protein n=1 Tax=Massilia sp. AB1 TaxID=2823371 RepID=UPI001B815554|nr:RDD family protein [Massilia sp. AB1]MBQ5938961.1 RDD family protein [Massilia sp. AB1]